MVRLVFRPYTQVRKAICTSAHLRASTRVSSGFALLRHSSPSFGSQQVCSYSNPWQERPGWSMLRSRDSWHQSGYLRFTWVCHPPARIHVRLLGPCFKTGRLDTFCQHPEACGSSQARLGHPSVSSVAREAWPGCSSPGVLPPGQPMLTSPEWIQRVVRDGPRGPRGTHGFQSLPSQQFQALFDSLFKVLFIFPSRYLFAIGLPSVFSLRWDLPPALGCIPKQPDSRRASRGVARRRGPRGSHPLRRPFPGNLDPSRHRGRFHRLQFASRGLEILTLGSSRFARRY
jgi:hypothetical protein